MTRVRDIMSAAVVTVAPDTSLSRLARVLDEHGISGAPVVDPDGRVLGVVSTTDIAREARYGTNPAGRTAVAVMTHGAVSVRPDASVQELARFLSRAQVHRALVLDGGKLVGIVTAHDALAALAGVDPPPPRHWPPSGVTS